MLVEKMTLALQPFGKSLPRNLLLSDSDHDGLRNGQLVGVGQGMGPPGHLEMVVVLHTARNVLEGGFHHAHGITFVALVPAFEFHHYPAIISNAQQVYRGGHSGGGVVRHVFRSHRNDPIGFEKLKYQAGGHAGGFQAASISDNVLDFLVYGLAPVEYSRVSVKNPAKVINLLISPGHSIATPGLLLPTGLAKVEPRVKGFPEHASDAQTFAALFSKRDRNGFLVEKLGERCGYTVPFAT